MILERGRKSAALKVVIYGPEGIGKSTFASQFPNPVFIDTEGSTTFMDVARAPKALSWTELTQQVDYFIQNTHLLGTLVVDTADWAEKLCTEQLCASKNVSGIEDLLYGKGYVYQAEDFGKFLNQLEKLKERGVYIVLNCHAIMRKFEQPDEMGSYDRWELKLSKKIGSLVKEWADMILFANYKTIVVNVDGKGATKGKNKATGGRRVMYTTHHPCWDAKNRFGLQDELPFEFAQIAHLVQEIRPVQTQAPVPVPEERPQEITAPDPLETRYPGIAPALAALMEANDVKPEEIQAVAAARGYFPADMPVRDYPADFVNGWCIAFWPQLQDAILANRQTTPF